MDIDSYEFSGDELLDRLDTLKAAQNHARYHLELYNEQKREHAEQIPGEYIETPRTLEHAIEKLEEAHQELDQLFEQEHTKFPIETVETDQNGYKTSCITVIETEASNYEEMADALAEINGNLTDGQPGMNYSAAPSPIAAVDHSEQLINEQRKLEETYEMFQEAL